MNKVTCYIDGACSNNPGKGGWGVLCLIHTSNSAIFLNGGENHTTNNRMELMAAIKLFEYFLNQGSQFQETLIYTDSQYLRNGVTDWIHKWQKNGWRSSSKQPVKNKDLWQTLLDKSQGFNVVWEWVRSHSDNVGNIIADSLAVMAKDKII